MKEINQIEAEKKYKIFTHHQEMDNGELRFRLLKNDGTGYAITDEPDVEHNIYMAKGAVIHTMPPCHERLKTIEKLNEAVSAQGSMA